MESKVVRQLFIFILPFAIIAILMINIYFRSTRTPDPATVQPQSPEAILPVTDSVKSNIKNPPAALQNDSAQIQTEEKAVQTNQALSRQKEPVTELLIKFTTDDTCKLKITNISLGDVINWNLSQYDNGTLYLKPGKYSIVAASVIGISKTKTYYFDVKPGSTPAMQNLHIQF